MEDLSLKDERSVTVEMRCLGAARLYEGAEKMLQPKSVRRRVYQILGCKSGRSLGQSCTRDISAMKSFIAGTTICAV